MASKAGALDVVVMVTPVLTCSAGVRGRLSVARYPRCRRANLDARQVTADRSHRWTARFQTSSVTRRRKAAPAADSGYEGKMLMAREMTSRPITSDVAASTSMVSLPQVLTGNVSVGLNAVALVNARYR